METKKYPSIEVSSTLIYHVHSVLHDCLEAVRKDKSIRHGLVSSHHRAFPAYFSAVAAVEAFLNEVFLSEESKSCTPRSPLWHIPPNELERFSICDKLYVIPKLLFDQTFSRGGQPFQDMQLLVRVRNYLIHYRNDNYYAGNKGSPRKLIDELVRKGVALEDNGILSSVIRLSTANGVLWAHDTACKVITDLLSFASEPYQISDQQKRYFKPLTTEYIKNWYIEHRITM